MELALEAEFGFVGDTFHMLYVSLEPFVVISPFMFGTVVCEHFSPIKERRFNSADVLK